MARLRPANSPDWRIHAKTPIQAPVVLNAAMIPPCHLDRCGVASDVAATRLSERFHAKWMPVRVKETRQNKN